MNIPPRAERRLPIPRRAAEPEPDLGRLQVPITPAEAEALGKSIFCTVPIQDLNLSPDHAAMAAVVCYWVGLLASLTLICARASYMACTMLTVTFSTIFVSSFFRENSFALGVEAVRCLFSSACCY